MCSVNESSSEKQQIRSGHITVVVTREGKHQEQPGDARRGQAAAPRHNTASKSPFSFPVLWLEGSIVNERDLVENFY